MPFQIIRNDITKMKVDAIVNAANPSLLGGGGVDGAIHKAAGPKLLAACKKLNGCAVGQAKITEGYALPAKYVIHTVGPIYKDGAHDEKNLLASCYRESLQLAHTYRCESVAFPLISSGAYGYPKDQALHIAVDTVRDFLTDHDMTVYLVIFDRTSYQIGEKLYPEIHAYINDRYAETHRIERSRFTPFLGAAKAVIQEKTCDCQASVSKDDLQSMLEDIDESFSQMLLRKIDEKGITDAVCYKKANIDRKLFSKIRSDIHYKPSKPTAIAFAIALELSLEETNDLLRKAGFALSHSNKFDIIIEYFITKKIYDIFEINETLFAFDQNLLGV